MINITIVDDDKDCYQTLYKYLEKFQSENDVKFNITYFSNPLTFIEEYQSADIVLMDIEMPSANGIETAEKLRKIDSNVILIFITNFVQYAIKGYSVNALDYVLKPVNYARLCALLSKTLKSIHSNKDEEITIKTNEGLRKFRSSDIYFVEVSNHLLFLYTKNGDYEVWDSLKSFEKKLPENKFYRCNNSTIVNLEYVKGFYKNEITLEHISKKISVSHSKKQDFAQKLSSFLKI